MLTGPATTAATPGAPRPANGRHLRTVASAEHKLLALVNKKRVVHGCAALKPNRALHRASRRHSKKMAAYGYNKADWNAGVYHQLPGEPALRRRMIRAGYKHPTWWGENIAYSSGSTPRLVFRTWLHSRGHRRNMFNCHFQDGNVGLATGDGLFWWTLDLGRN